MKKITIIMAILIASLTTVKSQFSVAIPVGVSTLKTPTMGINFQAQIGGLIIASGLDHHVSPKVIKGTFYWARIGGRFQLADLNSLEISTGGGTHHRSQEVKRLNEGLILVNAQYVHEMKYHPEASVFASLTGTKKFAMFTAGLRLTFLGRERSGCPSTRIR